MPASPLMAAVTNGVHKRFAGRVPQWRQFFWLPVGMPEKKGIANLRCSWLRIDRRTAGHNVWYAKIAAKKHYFVPTLLEVAE